MHRIFSILPKIPVSGDLKTKFQQSLVFMSRLESYYIPSRYGVDTAGRVHYLKYDPDLVRELSRAAGDFLELCLEFFIDPDRDITSPVA